MRIARLGDRAAAPRGQGPHEPQKRHQFAEWREATEVPDFRDQADRCDKRDAAQHLQR